MKRLLIIFILLTKLSYGGGGTIMNIGFTPQMTTYQVSTVTYTHWDLRTARNINWMMKQLYFDNANYGAVWILGGYNQNYTYYPFINNESLGAATVVNSWTWTSGVGYGSSSNTTGYMNLNFIFSSLNSSHYSLNNGGIGFAVSGNSTSGTLSDMGADEAGNATFSRCNPGATNNSTIWVNQATSTYSYSGVFEGVGMYSFYRTSSTNTSLYFNGAAIGLTPFGNNSSLVPTTINCYIGAISFTGGSAIQNTPYIYSFCFVGNKSVNQLAIYLASRCVNQ